MGKFWIIAVLSAMFLAMASGQHRCCQNAGDTICAVWSRQIQNCEFSAELLCNTNKFPRTKTGCRTALKPLCANLTPGRGGPQQRCQMFVIQVCNNANTGCK